MLKLTLTLLISLTVTLWTTRQLLELEHRYESALQQPAAQSGEIHRFTELEITEFDKNGHRKSRVSSPSASYSPDTQLSLLAQPNILLFSYNKGTTDIRAEEATITHDNNHLVLSNNVQINTASAERKGTLLETSKLNVDIKNEIAHTDRPVTIKNNNIIMHAVGMDLDYATQKIKLLSSVRGEHDS